MAFCIVELSEYPCGSVTEQNCVSRVLIEPSVDISPIWFLSKLGDYFAIADSDTGKLVSDVYVGFNSFFNGFLSGCFDAVLGVQCAAMVRAMHQLTVAYLKVCDYTYTIGKPIIDDSIYDQLQKQFDAFLQQHGLTKVMYRSGDDGQLTAAPLGDYVHPYPMLSLTNAYTSKDLSSWCKNNGINELQLEPKYDGMALEIVFNGSGQYSCITRGDGLIGENLGRLPIATIHPYEHAGTVVRGEAIITHSDWALLCQEYPDKYNNRRNAVAGICRTKDPLERDPLLKYVTFYAYTLVSYCGEDVRDQNYINIDCWLGNWCRPKRKSIYVTEDGVLVHSALKSWDDLLLQLNLWYATHPYDIDGVVFKVIDSEKIRQMGDGSRAPKHMRAYKFPQVAVNTKLLAIDWQVGQSGVLTPVARVAPVRVGDVTVTSVTLHNHRLIGSLDLRIGCTVGITRAAGVIPKIVNAADQHAHEIYTPLTRCVACNEPLVKSEVSLRCTNIYHCEGIIAAKILNACDHHTLDIGLVGKVTAAQYAKKLKGRNFAHFLELLVADELKYPKRVPVYRLVGALGISGVGLVGAKALVANTSNIAEVFGKINEPYARESLSALIAHIEPEWIPLSKKHILVSGKVDGYTRQELRRLFVSMGYDVVEQMSKNVVAALFGQNANPAKRKAAHALGAGRIFLDVNPLLSFLRG